MITDKSTSDLVDIPTKNLAYFSAWNIENFSKVSIEANGEDIKAIESDGTRSVYHAILLCKVLSKTRKNNSVDCAQGSFFSPRVNRSCMIFAQ